MIRHAGVETEREEGGHILTVAARRVRLGADGVEQVGHRRDTRVCFLPRARLVRRIGRVGRVDLDVGVCGISPDRSRSNQPPSSDAAGRVERAMNRD